MILNKDIYIFFFCCKTVKSAICYVLNVLRALPDYFSSENKSRQDPLLLKVLNTGFVLLVAQPGRALAPLS